MFIKVRFGIFFLFNSVYALPAGFVYLHSFDPSIQQEIRYSTTHNVIGRPLRGYDANKCILTTPAALALTRIQAELKPKGLALKVYDCYRPTTAVQDLISWSELPYQQKMKSEFYPRVNKTELFSNGYFALRSGHSRGSTVDLTIVPLQKIKRYHSNNKKSSCYATYWQRSPDNSIDMGTGYDCLDVTANYDYDKLPDHVKQNRIFLRALMLKNGFMPYDKEWWHFQLKNETFPKRYFSFPVI